MGYQAIFTGTITTRSRRLTLDIEQNTASVPAPDAYVAAGYWQEGYTTDAGAALPPLSTVIFEQRLEWNYGSVTGGTVGNGTMTSSSVVRVLDPNRAIFDHIGTARSFGAEDKDFRLHIYDEAGEVSLWGIIRVKEVSTAEAVWTTTPVTTLRVYDGLGDNDRLIFNPAHITTLIRVLNLQWGAFPDEAALPLSEIDYRSDFTAGNLPAGFHFETALTLHHTVARYKQQRQWSKYIEFITNMLWARIWQGFDGRWHIEQPHLTGRAGTVLRSGAFETVLVAEETTHQLVRAEVGARDAYLSRSLHDPVVAVEARRTFEDFTDPGVFRGHVYNMVRAGKFDTAENHPLEHWLPGSLGGGTGSIDSRGFTDECLLLDEDEANEQALPWISEGEKFFFQLRLKYALENVSTSGNKKAFLRLRWEPWDTAKDPTYYVAVIGPPGDNVEVLYTASNTVLSSAEHPMDANGAGSLTWWDWHITMGHEAPTTGRLVIELLGASGGVESGYNTLFDDVFVHIAQPNADDGTGIAPLVETSEFKTVLRKFRTVEAPLIGETIEVKLPVPHISANVFEGVPLFTEDEIKFYSFFNLSASPNRFSVDHFIYNGEKYTDPLELVYHYVRDLVGGFRWGLEGSLDGLYPPEVPVRDLEGQTFTMLSGTLDLVEETTRGVWIENALEPIVMPPVLTIPIGIYFTEAKETSGSPTVLNRMGLTGLGFEQVDSWTPLQCGFDTFEDIQVGHFHPDTNQLLLVDSEGVWVVDRDGAPGASCPTEIIPDGVIVGRKAQFDYVRDRVYYLKNNITTEVRYRAKDGSGDALLKDLGFSATSSSLEYDPVRDSLFVLSNSPRQCYELAIATLTVTPRTSTLASNTDDLSYSQYTNEIFYVPIDAPFTPRIRRHSIETDTFVDVDVPSGTPIYIRHDPGGGYLYYVQGTGTVFAKRQIRRVPYAGGIDELVRQHGSQTVGGMVLPYWTDGRTT